MHMSPVHSAAQSSAPLEGKQAPILAAPLNVAASASGRQTFTYKARAGETFDVSIVGSGNSDLDLEVLDPKGEGVCRSYGLSDKETCRIVAKFAGEYTIIVTNLGAGVVNEYRITMGGQFSTHALRGEAPRPASASTGSKGAVKNGGDAPRENIRRESRESTASVVTKSERAAVVERSAPAMKAPATSAPPSTQGLVLAERAPAAAATPARAAPGDEKTADRSPVPGGEPVSCAELGIAAAECGEHELMLKKLKAAKLAYNRPESMQLDEPIQISLLVNPADAQEVKEQLGGLPGAVREGETKVARHMSAELNGGAAFEVDPKGPQQRDFTRVTATRWDWKVTPKVDGEDQLLTLDIYVHLVAKDGKSSPIRIHTYRDKIRVDVSVWRRLSHGLSGTAAIVTALGGIVVALWGAYAWVRKRGWKVGSPGPRRPKKKPS